MADQATSIKINPSKPSDLEFDVTIQGVDDKTQPVVRFVVAGSDCDYSYKCAKVGKTKQKWHVNLPVLPYLKEDTTFRVEVVIDGYYFEPAEGTLVAITDPSVKFKQETSKPTVTTSFTVKQDNVKEDVVPSPNNELLVPEFDPTLPDVEPEDNQPLAAQISIVSIELPAEEEPDDDQLELEEPFDPKKVAESIVKTTVGRSVKKPEIKGSLFKRDSGGKLVVEGLDSVETKREKLQKAELVKNILSGN